MIPMIYGAPMAGITDKPFRTIIHSFGSQTLFTEMISVNTLYHNHPVTRKMLKISDEKNTIVQLVGIEPAYMIYAAKQAEFYGAIGININMGCPVKKLITNGSGAAFMKTPLVAAHLIEEIKKSVSIPVSVKTRIGWDNEHINGITFAKTMQEAGADSIIIHGRTKEQGYSGTADWEIIRNIKEIISVPIIANGDIVDYQTAQKAFKLTQADGLMIGRGLLGKPWILQEIETGKKPIIQLSDLILRHLDLMMDYYGQHGLLVARKHLAWYAKGKKDVAQFCQNVYAEKQIETVKRMIQDFFENKQNEIEEIK